MSERSPNSQQLLTPSKAERAVYIDFEALATAPRVIGLLGVAFRDGADQVVVRQFVVDEILRGAVKSRPACDGASLEEAVRIVVEQVAAVDGPIVSWSNHDRDLRRSGFDLKPLDVQQRHVRSEELHATALLTRARTSAPRALNARAIPIRGHRTRPRARPTGWPRSLSL